jgi:signal transduction histidine kinase
VGNAVTKSFPAYTPKQQFTNNQINWYPSRYLEDVVSAVPMGNWCKVGFLAGCVAFGYLTNACARPIPSPSVDVNPNQLRIAAARSAKDLGLVHALADQFQKQHNNIDITISSGGVLQVLDDGRRGRADVVFSHHELAESRFVRDGYALRHTRVMYTEYAVFGPPGDPLSLSSETDVISVFKKLADAQVRFHAPSPQSATNMKIEEIWSMAGIDPQWTGYENTGVSGYATLLQAADLGVYTIAEMATYIANKDEFNGGVVPLYRDDINLRNTYSVAVVNPNKVPGVNTRLALAFHDYLVSDKGQEFIRRFAEQHFNASVLVPAARFDPRLRELLAQQALEEETNNLRLSITATIALILLLLTSILLFLRMRKVERRHLQTKLHGEAMELARDEIMRSNKRLQREIEEHKRTEQRLKEAVDGLNASEAELKSYRDHLEALVDARTRELQTAVNELQAFSYSVSHDLRSPLRSISGFSHVLLEGSVNKLDDDGTRYLKRIISASERMDMLIDGLLQLSHISQHDLDHKTIDLGTLASEVLNSLRLETEERCIQADIEEDLTTHGDENMMRVVMENLLRNALKFTRQNRAARISVGKTVRNNTTCFYVKDNGVGFNSAEGDKLFKPFQRLHDDPSFEGHGIGLSTVQRIVERHGGTIWAQSQPGEGATFYFTLSPMITNGTVNPSTMAG